MVGAIGAVRSTGIISRMKDVKRLEKFLAMAISKGEAAWHTLISPKFTDAGNDFARHRKFSPVPTNEAFPGSNAEEPVAALSVTSGTKADPAGGTINHLVIMFLMYLGIISKR